MRYWNIPPCPQFHNMNLMSWWRHQMETFSALLTLCGVTVGFPSQRPVTRSFGVFFDVRLNTRLSKRSGGWWLETPLGSLWRHCYGEVASGITLELYLAQEGVVCYHHELEITWYHYRLMWSNFFVWNYAYTINMLHVISMNWTWHYIISVTS